MRCSLRSPEIGRGVCPGKVPIVTARNYRKRLHYRQLSHVTMTDDDVLKFDRIRALRQATERLTRRQMTDDEWYDICRQLRLLVAEPREPR
jgi:hypothetical protein